MVRPARALRRRVGGAARGTAGIDAHRRAVGEAHDGEQVAADAAVVRVGDRQGRRRRQRGVERVAAGLGRRDRRLRGVTLGRGDHDGRVGEAPSGVGAVCDLAVGDREPDRKIRKVVRVGLDRIVREHGDVGAQPGAEPAIDVLVAGDGGGRSGCSRRAPARR